jgi:hypothetical protein
VNFASLNLSATDANQFTVTSYGTLNKTNNYCLWHYLNQPSFAFKNNVVSSFKHTFTNNIAGSVMQLQA